MKDCAKHRLSTPNTLTVTIHSETLRKVVPQQSGAHGCHIWVSRVSPDPTHGPSVDF